MNLICKWWEWPSWWLVKVLKFLETINDAGIGKYVNGEGIFSNSSDYIWATERCLKKVDSSDNSTYNENKMIC